MNFFLVVFFFPVYLFAQPETGENNELAGLWKGYLSTTDKKLPYELVITEKDGKLSGYSYTTFNVNGEDIVSLKKVSIHWQNKSIIVEDNELLFDNFPSEAPKKIKQTNILFLKIETKPFQLTGMFESKATRTIRSARGAIYLEKKQTDDDTKLIAKLDEMNLSSSLSFSLIPEVAKPTKDSLITVVEKTIQPIIVTATAPKPEITKAPSAPVINNPVNVPTTIITKQPVVSKPIVATTPAAAPVIAKTTPTPVIKKQPATLKPPVAAKPTPAPAIVKATPPPVVNIPVAAKPVIKNIAVAPVLDLSNRKIETIEQLYIRDDSLQLTLYDNGIIDGDSVSLILNGKTIVSKLMLSTVPFNQTIYLTPDLGDTIQLVMYAENLGSLPPNTGLLILQYDKQRNEIRFSGDLTKNAAITLRRKEKNE